MTTAVLLVLLGAFSRLLPHPPNFVALGALALFSGARCAGAAASVAGVVSLDPSLRAGVQPTDTLRKELVAWVRKDIGPIGTRMYYDVSGGEVTGERLRGKVLPGGGDLAIAAGRIAMQAAGGLAEAERRGGIHRRLVGGAPLGASLPRRGGLAGQGAQSAERSARSKKPRSLTPATSSAVLSTASSGTPAPL